MRAPVASGLLRCWSAEEQPLSHPAPAFRPLPPAPRPPPCAGKYLMVKDPNKPQLRIYAIPTEAAIDTQVRLAGSQRLHGERDRALPGLSLPLAAPAGVGALRGTGAGLGGPAWG